MVMTIATTITLAAMTTATLVISALHFRCGIPTASA